MTVTVSVSVAVAFWLSLTSSVKVEVVAAQAALTSAVTLPEWTREEIKVGDLVSVNTPAP